MSEILIEMNAGSLGLTLPATSTHGVDRGQRRRRSSCACPRAWPCDCRRTTASISSFDYEDQGLVQNGDTWSSPDFDTAAQRIDLVTEGNAASFTLNPEEGCRG